MAHLSLHTSTESIASTDLKRLERRMFTAFGTMIGLMMLVVMLSAGAYFHYTLNEVKNDLSIVLTRILADSVSRASFSGKYQTRLLLEEIKRQQPDIIHMLITDRNGQILAHTDPKLNDTHLDPAALQQATRLLQGKHHEIRNLKQNGTLIREVTLPYRSGFDNKLSGVVQVGLADRQLLSAVIKGGWFALAMGLLLLSTGLTIGFLYINRYFISPVRLMALQLEGILANTPAQVAIFDSEGVLTSCSNTYRRFFGLTPAGEQHTTLKTIYGTNKSSMMEQITGSIRENGNPVELEMTVSDQAGNPHTFLVSSFPILSDKGEMQLVGSFGVDLTDLRTTEQALRQSLAEVERISAAKSEFLSRMSHELRTPLNAIIGFSQIMQSDPYNPLNEEQQDNVKEILRAGRHLLELINEILDLARVESGHLTIALEGVSILRLFEECSALITPLAEQRGITLSYATCCPGNKSSCLLLCDQLRTRQVILNLLSNAVKYNRDNGTVTLQCSLLSDDLCRISVSDTGDGIDEAFLPRMFEPFERAVPESGIEGTGIGLALAKRLVEAMGGRIGVVSQPGQGSTFWFELPSAGRHGAIEETLAATTESAVQRSADQDTSRHTILSIEDNATNQRLIRKILANRPGITLLEASSAEDGLELVRNCRVELILMDINLPGMDGFEALSLLKESAATASIPIVAISANALQSETDRALQAGFKAYLTKPVQVSQLLEHIDNIITISHEESA
jgi:PAS domain S-box-containing protein